MDLEDQTVFDMNSGLMGHYRHLIIITIIIINSVITIIIISEPGPH